MTIDTQSTDQSEAQQLTSTTTHELFKPLIAPSLNDPYSRYEISDCTIGQSRCGISDDVMALIWNYNDTKTSTATLLTSAFSFQIHD